MDQPLIADRYRPLEFLGEGAFGSVTLAWDTRMQRRVAIKRLPLPPERPGRPRDIAALAEARTAAMLSHPNIVTVFDVETDSDEAFLVMEYVDGSSLAALLDRLRGPLEPDEAAAVIADVASALTMAHDNGVLHLDIKPENVIITRDGRAKVADFGIAELSSLAGHSAAFGGTPGYMPVEQLAGHEVSERTDEWALAVLAFETLTGDNPFADGSVADSVMRMEVFDPPAPSEYEPQLDPALDDILLAALGTHPSDRYETVADFAEVLLPRLGDPSAGRQSLAELIDAHFAEDIDDDADYAERIGLWDRLAGRPGRVLVRGIAALEAGWLGWIGLSVVGLESAALAGAVALVALAAALAPGLGIGLGLACFLAGFAARGAWLLAVVTAVLGGAWWWAVARHRHGAAVLPLSGPVLATMRVPFVEPLVAGFVLPPVAAAATGLAGGTLVMLASALSAEGPPYLVASPADVFGVWQRSDLAASAVATLVRSPSAYIALLGWPVAAALMSLACRRASRLGAVAGTIGGSAVLGTAYYAAQFLAELTEGADAATWTGETLAVALGSTLAVMLLVIALGPPVRAEEE